MARGRDALANRTKGVDLCADWWAGGGAYHLAAGANRKCSQLGLSVLLASRCGVDLARVNARGLSRRSRVMAAMASARDCRKPGPNANHLRRARRTSSRRIRDSLVVGL